jgi:hypothetical protein
MKKSKIGKKAKLVGFLALLTISIGPRECFGNDPNNTFGGLTFRLTEERAGTDYHILADKTTQVDFRSTLFLHFNPPHISAEAEEASRAWKGVQELLKMAVNLESEYETLNKELIDINDPIAVDQFQARVNIVREQITQKLFPKALALAEDFGLSQDQFVELLIVGAEDSIDEKPPVYRNLKRFLEQQIERLQDETQRLRKDKDGYQVTVIAIRRSRGRQAQAIHVDPYDNLPGGQLQSAGPLEEYGIRMTPEDLSRFRMGTEMSQQVADAIREMRDSRAKIRSGLKQALNILETKLEQLLEQFSPEGSELAAWQKKLTEAIQQLEVLEKASDTSAKVKKAATELRAALEATRTDLQTASEIVMLIKQLQDRLTNDQTADLFEVVAGANGVITTLEDLADRVKKLTASLGNWPKWIETITDNVPTVGGEIVKITVVNEIKAYFANLPKTAKALGAILTYISGANEIGGTADIAHEQIYYDINENAPPTATIELNSYPLERKEIVVVKVQFRSKDSLGADEVEHVKFYRLEIEKLETHTSVLAALIFARASTGTREAKRWSPNVAAMVNWHYRNREPLDRGDRIWNWLNPGAGVHLASLDQGDDTVEFGIGASLSFWNGLLNAGYGYNLSQPEDREYFFVGLNLLHLLDVARGTASTPSWERGIDYR